MPLSPLRHTHTQHTPLTFTPKRAPRNEHTHTHESAIGDADFEICFTSRDFPSFSSFSGGIQAEKHQREKERAKAENRVLWPQMLHVFVKKQEREGRKVCFFLLLSYLWLFHTTTHFVFFRSSIVSFFASLRFPRPSREGKYRFSFFSHARKNEKATFHHLPRSLALWLPSFPIWNIFNLLLLYVFPHTNTLTTSIYFICSRWFRLQGHWECLHFESDWGQDARRIARFVLLKFFTGLVPFSFRSIVFVYWNLVAETLLF